MAHSPRHAALTNPRPLTVKDVQTRVVDRDSVLLQYFLGTSRSYVWAITADRTVAYALPGRAEIERCVRPYREALSNPAGPHDAPVAVRRSIEQEHDDAVTLSRMLLGPVLSALDRPRVLILADGILQLLPFAALPTPGSTTTELLPLIVEHEVVHLPSASTLALVRSQWNRKGLWSKPVVVFADPVFEAGDPRISAEQKRASIPPSIIVPAAVPRKPESLAGARRDVPGFPCAAIPRLLESGREASGIKALVSGADVRLGFEANRAAAACADMAKYRIVHFATHGIINDRHPELSGIILSLFDRDGKAQDGYLRLHDIYNLRLPVDLVVLSACSTALGKDVPGEGLIGLVRGFMHAGSRRVIASLWKVDDEATTELMTRFYRGLFEKALTPPAALRAAQVELLRSSRWTRPFYWAAFVLQGEWN
jgi:CHAT domain-containing protein